METLEGKVAVVTGGASGIGLALARRFLADGARVALADVEKDALDAVAGELGGEHGADRVLAVRADVREPDDVEALAAATFDRFGTAHVVCNNAGVGVGGRAWEVPADRWRWIVDVNLIGVANGIRAFVPRLIEQGEGHVVNTASAAGLLTGPGMSPYYATKHAVVALSESLAFDLAMVESPVGVSVLCPEWVRTNIFDSERNRPADVSEMAAPAPGPEPEPSPSSEDGDEATPTQRIREVIQGLVAEGIDPAEVAGHVADAVRSGRFWVLTHDTTLDLARRRWDAIATGGDPVYWDVTAGRPDAATGGGEA
jgi:NAD(P)-dependent dehydrogenase (short-subunit alcohol dehydrogenase family)